MSGPPHRRLLGQRSASDVELGMTERAAKPERQDQTRPLARLRAITELKNIRLRPAQQDSQNEKAEGGYEVSEGGQANEAGSQTGKKKQKRKKLDLKWPAR